LCGVHDHVALESRLLFVIQRAVERLHRRLQCGERGERDVYPLLNRFETRRQCGGHLLRAVGGEPFCGFLRGVA